MADDFPKNKPVDPVYLFIRTDEKYEEVRGELHDVRREQIDQRNDITRIEKRVDFGVALTGQKNADEIKDHEVKLDRLMRTQELEEQRLTNIEAKLLSEIGEIKKWLIPIYKGIVAIFFTLVAGGAIVYFLRFFKFT